MLCAHLGEFEADPNSDEHETRLWRLHGLLPEGMRIWSSRRVMSWRAARWFHAAGRSGIVGVRSAVAVGGGDRSGVRP